MAPSRRALRRMAIRRTRAWRSHQAVHNPNGQRPSRATQRVRRPGQAALVAGLAVVVIGIAGAVIYPSVREELAQARMSAAARPSPNQAAATLPAAKAQAQERQVSDAPDRAETRTRLVVLRTGKDGDARPLVAPGASRGKQE